MLSEKSQGWPERRIDSAFCETRSLRLVVDSELMLRPYTMSASRLKPSRRPAKMRHNVIRTTTTGHHQRVAARTRGLARGKGRPGTRRQRECVAVGISGAVSEWH